MTASPRCLAARAVNVAAFTFCVATMTVIAASTADLYLMNGRAAESAAGRTRMLLASIAERRIRIVKRLSVGNKYGVEDLTGGRVESNDVTFTITDANANECLRWGEMTVGRGGNQQTIRVARPIPGSHAQGEARCLVTEVNAGVVERVTSSTIVPGRTILKNRSLNQSGNAEGTKEELSLGVARAKVDHEAEIERHVTLQDYGEYVSAWLERAWPALIWVSLSVGVLFAGLTRRIKFLPLSLYRAVSKREFIPYYQPIVRVDSHGRAIWTGFEVLMRWKRSDGTLVLPGDFLPGNEQRPVCLAMTVQMIREVCKDIHCIEALQGKTLSINLSVAHMRNLETITKILEEIQPVAAEHQVRLQLEIAERSKRPQPGEFRSIVSALHNKSVAMVIDDFGTANANVDYLADLDVDGVKLDRSLVALLNMSDPREVITIKLIEIAKHLKKSITAEGVETKEQRDALVSLGVNDQQGYFHARPMDASTLAQELGRHMQKDEAAASHLQDVRTSPMIGGNEIEGALHAA